MRGRRAGALVLAILLGACGGPAEPVWAPQDAVDRARYAAPGPGRVTLVTVRSTNSGFGAHSGLVISGSERVIFDPAGTFELASVPERNDLHYGITPDVLAVYIDYHARETYDVILQEVAVTRAEADALIARAADHGAVPKAQCALSIAAILNSQPRFQGLPSSYFPNRLSQAFGALPGVSGRTVTDDDADANHGVLIRAQGAG